MLDARKMSTNPSATAATIMPFAMPPSVMLRKNCMRPVLLVAEVVVAEVAVPRHGGRVLADDHLPEVDHHRLLGDGQRAAGVLLDEHDDELGVHGQVAQHG